MNVLSIPPLIMAGITFYLAFFHLLIYSRRRQERQHLTFALTCGVMAFYDLFSAGLYNATLAAQGVHWQRAQVVTLALLGITFPWFVVDYFAHVSPFSARTKKWITAFSVYFALAAVVGAVDRSGLVRPLDRPAIKEIQLLWGSRITYYEMEPGPLTNLQSLMGLALFIYILWLTADIYRKGHRKARPLLGAITLFFVAVVNDTAVAIDLYPFVYVMEYAYMGMVLLMTYALTGEVVEVTLARKALRESEERYQTVLEAIEDGYFEVDLTGDFTFFNDAMLGILGYSEGEMMGMNYREYVSETTAKRIYQAFNHVYRTGVPNRGFDWQLIGKEGGERWVSVSVVLIRGQRGRAVGFRGIARDITERKRAEEALRESEERYRALFEHANDAIFLENQDDEIVDANRRACEMLGYTRRELLQLKVPDLQAPEVRGEEGKVIKQELEQYGDASFETVDLHRDGTRIPAEVSLSRMPGRETGLVLAIVRDITERKQAETEILRLQHLLQNITDSMPSALITVNPEGQVLTWNPAAEALTGRGGEQMLGHSLWQSCPELTHYRNLVEKVLRKGRAARQHRERRSTEGGVIYQDADVFPLITNDLEGAVLRIDDVTRRVQLEEMMLQSDKMASLGGLAAGVAHEINNPLGAMLQSAQVLQMAFDTRRTRIRERLLACGVDPQGLDCYLQERGLLDYLEGIRDTGARAAKIVSDLLSFSRKATSDAAPHDLNLLVERTLELAAVDYDLKKRYDFRDIEIVRELAPGLSLVLCDRQQIQQVILNLVRNAAQAMAGANSGRRPRLTLRTLRRDEWIRLEVEDNGPGIPEAIRERLFEPFFTTKDVGEGVGLGLWLCWSIVVERHGGRIWVEPVVEGGTRFVIELPAAKDGQGW